MYPPELIDFLCLSILGGAIGSLFILLSVYDRYRKLSKRVREIENDLEHIKIKLAALHAQFYTVDHMEPVNDGERA